MDLDAKLRALGMGTLMLVFILLGLLVGLTLIIALIASWRNHNRRQHLLDQARAHRDSQWDKNESPDAWAEAGKRYDAAATKPEPREPLDPDEDDASRYE